jgi:hypothetical protein
MLDIAVICVNAVVLPSGRSSSNVSVINTSSTVPTGAWVVGDTYKRY